MGSATTQAIADGRAALAETKGESLELGRELLAARDALADAPQLKSALADVAADGPAKAALVERVFAGVSDGTKAVLQRAVIARWSTPDDLLAGLEELGILAIAGSGDTDQILAELAGFQRAVTADPELEYAVGSALVAGTSKGAVVERLLTGKALPQTIAILAALVSRADGRRIGALIKRASDLVADQGGRVVATVRTATPLSSTQADQLRATIAAAEGRDVVLTEYVDPTVVGGVRVVIGDRVIDGSVASRLHDLRLALAG